MLLLNIPFSLMKSTSMVNYWPERPEFLSEPVDTERLISATRPIYKLAEVQRLSPDRVMLATAKCRKDVAERLGWDIADVHHAIQQLNHAMHFKKAVWARLSTNCWLPCDAYSIRSFSDGYSEWLIDFYMKFGLSRTGTLLLVVSCHG